MITRDDVVQALVEAVRSEREIRIHSLSHTIKLLRGAALMVDALMLRENDDQNFYKLEAVHTQVNDLQLWLEGQLQQEAERQPITPEEADEKTIH